MKRRSGTTLVEVLVAIFIMGIGMIALLTLFPIGVLRMAQAINDERAAQAAYIAHENAIIYNIRNDVLTAGNAGVVTDGVTADFFAAAPAAGLKAGDPYGESYTLFVDPIGWNSGTTSQWVGGQTGLLRRRPVSFATTPATITRAFTLWDDMTYYNDPTLGLPGTPETFGNAAAPFIMRNARFSWAYTMRRPLTAEKSVVDCSIVVFDSRSLSLGVNLGLGEYVYPTAYFNANNNTVVVDYTTTTPPPIRPGNWIMDATQYQTTNAAGTAVGSQHNYWYRVLATQDVVVGANTLAVYEIQGQIRGFPSNFPNVGTDPTTSQSAYLGNVVILDGVAEVFEKGPVRVPVQ
jgi:type II secretory pathway pseudopilin PulG